MFVFVQPAWYLDNVSPPRLRGQARSPVQVQLTLLNILDINIVQSVVKTQFSLVTEVRPQN